MSWLMWLIVLIIAMSQHKRVIKYLGSSTPQIQKRLTSGSTAFKLGALKSENPVNSKFNEQHLLITLEGQLISNSLVETIAGPIDSSRWNEAVYPPASGLSDSAFFEISRLIVCSNGLNNPSNLCENIAELVQNSLYAVKMENSLIFAFTMRIETTPLSAALFRIKLHEYFRKKIWPILCKRIDFLNEAREIIFVGYESGGALASLAAWMTIKQFDTTKPAGIIVNNGNNQVKVITWDELPLFTQETAAKSPILPCNHSRFVSISIDESIYRQIAQTSGGLDEISYFSTSGDSIPLNSDDYTDFLKRFAAIESAKKSENDPWDPCDHLSRFFKIYRLREMGKDRFDKLSAILLLHRNHLAILHHLISNNYRSYMNDELLSEPNSYASALAGQLSNTIFPGSTISCRIDDFNIKTGTFKIYCSYQVSSANKSWSQFLSFDAVLADKEAHKNENDCLPFTEEVEIIDAKTQKKKKKNKNKMTEKPKIEIAYTVPVPISDFWSNCIQKLFEQQPHISLISPYTIRKNKIHPHCTYIPFPSNFPLSSRNRIFNKKNTGCYVVAPNIALELFQIYKSDPNFFYRVVNPDLMKFPASCKKTLVNIPFKATELEGLEVLQQAAVEYLTQLVSKNPMADTEVTLWRQMDTEFYKTLAFLGTRSISLKSLINQLHYEPDFDNSIIKCLSNLSYPYRDCTNPINRWIPAACPAACYQTHGAIDFLCRQVKSCPLAGYYISVANEGTLQQVTNIHEHLTNRPNPQFGIFHVQNKNMFYFGSSTFNVALFRIPSDQQ